MTTMTPAVRFHSSSAVRLRLITAAGAGAVAGGATALLGPWQLATLAGWDVAALTLLAWTWRALLGAEADDARRAAAREHTSVSVERTLVLCAAVLSLAGVVLGVGKAQDAGAGTAAVLIGLGVLTVAASWALVHTAFTVRYAYLYYSGTEGGIDFGEDHEPDFVDFAYLAFTVGMTFQVSDTTIGQRRIRRAVLGQALLSYVFGTFIVALTINLLAGLVK